MNYFDTVKAKLDGEEKAVGGSKETAMRGAVKEALLNFCRQDEEFAQAVADGGSFKDCMAAVTKGVGKKRGFEQVEILLVAHGGSKNDTICSAEVKR